LRTPPEHYIKLVKFSIIYSFGREGGREEGRGGGE